MPGFGSIRFVELLDILIFATVVYGVLVLTLRGASRRGAVALALVGFLYLFAKEWQLYLTLAVFEVGFSLCWWPSRSSIKTTFAGQPNALLSGSADHVEGIAALMI